MKLLPAIDLLDGQVVRLYQGDYSQARIFSSDPVETAKAFHSMGFGALHVVDLSGAKEGRPVHRETALSLSKSGLMLQVGGGVRTMEDAAHYLDNGVNRVIVGSSAILDPGFWSCLVQKYGKDRLVLSLDVREGIVAVHGWEQTAGKTIDEAIGFVGKDKVRNLLVTNILHDGTRKGPDVGLYKELLRSYPDFRIISAGGIDSPRDIDALASAGVHEAVVGRALYESPEEFNRFACEEIIASADWKKMNGTIPAIVQCVDDGTVLMHGYMTKEALRETYATGKVTFWSRSKGRLWAKGESSGNWLAFRGIALDCDKDAFVVQAAPAGPVCHEGTRSCFPAARVQEGFLQKLERIIDMRARHGRESSYVRRLMEADPSRMAQKVGEEGVEVAIASVQGDKGKILEESADLFFHALANLRRHGLCLDDVINVLQKRHRESWKN